MANINMNELNQEIIAKAMTCDTAEELMELAKAEGIELTKEEAKAYLAEMEDFELDSATLKQAAGGNDPKCPSNCPSNCPEVIPEPYSFK